MPIESSEKIFEAAPAISADPWTFYMRQGKYSEAWAVSDKILCSRKDTPCWMLPRHLQYIWDGSALHRKRVLVRCYHGLGDTIQFIRYIFKLKEIGASVIVWAQPELLPLLYTLDEIDQLLPLHDGKPEVDFDVDVEVMELPHVFRSTLETIPRPIPYIHVEILPLQTNKLLKVGLVWKAGDWDKKRTVPFDLMKSFLSLENIEFYILQQDAANHGWEKGTGKYPGSLPLHEYARHLKSMDVLVTVDSMPAHLAGAMGVKTWTMLHTEADWRWMENCSETPWYPDMRLFRQSTPGDWATVVQLVKTELARLIHELA